MRERDEVIKDQMDFILSVIYAEYLLSLNIIGKKEFNKVKRELRNEYDPPTKMMEHGNVKKSFKNRK